jgi:predicted component of type VI protein secretion system
VRTLRERLEQLHAELARTDSVDGEARRALESVLADIQKILERESAGEHEEEEERRASLADRLSEATRQFEESHPTLATTVGRVVDALANLGI